MAFKLKLNDTLSPASIFGIVSDLPDYRLCYILNDELSLKLCRSKHDKELYFKKLKLRYSEFVYHQKVAMRTWRLTSNAHAITYPAETGLGEKVAVPLVGDLRNMDYFVWYEDENNDELNNFILARLRSNKHIRAIQQIDPSASKNIENLLLEY